ncbi:MAG: hypothetical protein NC184_05715 [Roseburia sp.]|nr:hypothetical protein [Roseburia sp.]
MKYKYKLEIKENGAWTDYTAFCLQPFTLKDPLDETLSTLTVKMYLDREEALPPALFARFSIYEYTNGSYALKDAHDFVVNTDNAYKEVLSSRTYNAHEVVFVEPLALLQKYTVDNIALTYQLEDMVQYLDTGALKANLQLASTEAIRGAIADIPSNASISANLYYTYNFDPSPYTPSDGVQRPGLNEWSKIIYFKKRSGSSQLYRIDANGNEVGCGYYEYPYIPYCPLYMEEYNAKTGNVRRSQLAYDVYVEVVDLTTGKVIDPERLWRTVDLYKEDSNQFINGSTIGPQLVTNIGSSSDGSQYPNTTSIRASYKPKDELDVDYINSGRKAYFSRAFNDVTYYWFRVSPNRRYNIRYTRNRNLRFNDGVGIGNATARYVASGLPTNCMYYTLDSGEVVIAAPGADNPLQFPELRYSFDVLDVSADAGQIDVAVPTPSEYKYKYNCYEYLLKAFYTTGNYKEGDPLPFTMTDAVRQKLQMTVIYESQNSGGTLYDICLYIGRYIHSIPYCYFGENDLLYLDFLPLGKSDITPTAGRVTSVYNSRNLAEYLSSFDSYVNNLVNNDSTVEETLCAKSDDGSSLVYADNAVLQLSRPCYGIEEFYVAKRSAPTEWKTLINNTTINGASFICEKSIYEILDFRAQYTPNKGSCIYYTLGGKAIEGLQYKRPNPISAGEENTAIQNIIGRIWWYDTVASSVNINDYIFKIKYRTYDETRVRLFRPDLQKFIRNTANDHYPMQRSFRSQTEKVINSDFYGRNLTGELIRTGNEIKQRDLIVEHYDDLPRAGDLQSIDGIPHYASEITIPFYNEYISATVIYSKDFQRLSSIVSIPAENRFYEIATKGIIQRSVAKDEFVIVDTETHQHTSELTAAGRKCLLDRILSNNGDPISYAVATFKNRESNINEWSIDIVKPVHVFSLHSSLALSIEMEDNYSAGAQVVDSAGFNFQNANNMAGAFNALGSDIAAIYANALLNTKIDASARAYRAILPVRYCDKFGNADLYDLKLFGKQTPSVLQTDRQPLYVDNFQTPLSVSTNNELRKDNREAIKFVPQYNAIAGKDKIIIGPGFWKEKKKAVQCFAYTAQLNANDANLPSGGIAVGFSYNSTTGVITINAVPQNYVAIAFGYETADGDKELIFGINERTTQIALSFVGKISD